MLSICHQSSSSDFSPQTSTGESTLSAPLPRSFVRKIQTERYAFSPAETPELPQLTWITESLQRQWKWNQSIRLALRKKTKLLAPRILRGMKGCYTCITPFLNLKKKKIKILWSSYESPHDDAVPAYNSEPCVLFHLGSRVSPVLAACPHFSRARYFFHTISSGLHQFCSSSLSVYSYLTLPSVLLSWHRLCLPSLQPYVHTLFNNPWSENAIIECLGIQLDHRDMLFLPIPLAPFRWLNNVCVSSTSTQLDVDENHLYAKCVITMTQPGDGLRISGDFYHRMLAAKMR